MFKKLAHLCGSITVAFALFFFVFSAPAIAQEEIDLGETSPVSGFEFPERSEIYSVRCYFDTSKSIIRVVESSAGRDETIGNRLAIYEGINTWRRAAHVYYDLSYAFPSASESHFYRAVTIYNDGSVLFQRCHYGALTEEEVYDPDRYDIADFFGID